MPGAICPDAVDGGVCSGVGLQQTEADTSKGFGGTVEGVGGCGVADLFPTYGVLLVTELEDSVCDTTDIVLIIQRRRGATVDFSPNGEVNVLEEEGRGASVLFTGVAVLARAKEEEEGDDGEVDDVGVEGSPGGMQDVEGVEETPQDGEVTRVGACFGVVFVFEGLEESSEYGMEVCCVRDEAGIRLTQVGDPLADGLEGFTHCVRADRVVGRAGLAVLESVDKEESDLSLLARDITEGWTLADGGAEVDPTAEGVVFGTAGLTRGRGRGDVQRSAERSGELISPGRGKMVQG